MSDRARERHGPQDRHALHRRGGGLGLDKTSALTDDVVAEIAQRAQARPLAPPSDARKTLEAHRERIKAWLAGGTTAASCPDPRVARA